MKTLKRAFTTLLFASLTSLCLPPLTRGAQQQSSPAQAQDSSLWQTVLLKEKGISFRLPRQWRHNDADIKTENEFYTIEAMEWNTPDKEFIALFIHTYPGGFLTDDRRPATKEEMLEEEFNKTVRKESDLAFSEVKKVKAGSVEGVFSVLTLDFKDKEIGLRRGIFWTGYRIYQGKKQKIEINLSAHPKSDSILRAIFATLNIEQDNGTPNANRP